MLKAGDWVRRPNWGSYFEVARIENGKVYLYTTDRLNQLDYTLDITWEVSCAMDTPSPTLAPSRLPQPAAEPKAHRTSTAEERLSWWDTPTMAIEAKNKQQVFKAEFELKTYKAALPARALSRFPTHPSDILILLNELEKESKL